MCEGTRSCVRKRVGLRLAFIGAGCVLALAVAAVPVIHFYSVYWTRVQAMPARVKQRERRKGGQWTPLSRVSPWVPRALIATEDRTFRSNLGISFEGIGRALWVDLREHRLAQGGSTITQQLARDTLLTRAKTFRRKISGALLALLLTQEYSKSEIMTLYVNEVYLGAGAWGIAAASRRYFGVSPQALTLPEAALIAGLPQAPTGDDPLIHFKAAKARQRIVLDSMVADHMISQTRADRAYKAPLPLRSHTHA